MDDPSTLMIFLSVGVTALVVLVIVVLVLNLTNHGSSSGGGGTVGGGKAIPIESYPFEKNSAPWYSFDGGDPAISAKDGTLKIHLKGNATGASSGGGFKANPYKAFPATAVRFGYNVYFPSGFDWRKGGKLPGVCFGTGTNCATGSEWSRDAGSFRLMWREDGQAIGYAYLAITDKGSDAGNKAMKDQGPSFQKSVRLNQTNKSGLDIWHKNGTRLSFTTGWNRVDMYLVMNSPDSKNGEIHLTVNGKQNVVKDARMRVSDKVKFNSVNIVAFRGGNGNEWESNSDSYLEFKDFTISSSS